LHKERRDGLNGFQTEPNFLDEKSKGETMKRLIPVLCLSVLAMACDDLEGVISVRSQLVLKTKKEVIVLSEGSHHGRIDFDQGDNEIEIKVKNPQGKTREAKLRIPPGVVIPNHSGSFALRSSQSGQDFDLTGNIDTDVDQGPSQYSNETCTYTDRRPIVREVPVRLPNGRVIYKRETYWEYVTLTGSRDVRYHVTHTTVRGDATFLSPGGVDVIATFEGSRSWSQTVYEYQGPCLGYGGYHGGGLRRGRGGY
jgi:hypothetical protein